VYRDLRGRERSAGTFTNRRRAERAWQRAEADLSAGRINDPKRGRQTMRDYVDGEWFAHHMLEATTRESYRYLLDRYVLPELGHFRMVDLMPSDVREWVARLQDVRGTRPPTIKQAKVVLDAILTTAFNDQVTYLHAGKGVKTPAVARKPLVIVTVEQFEALYDALEDETMQLLVETGIESGLRWGELTELRPTDFDPATGVLTVSRAVVQLRAASRPDGVSFLVKGYPKDREWRRLRLADHLVAKLVAHIERNGIGPGDLIFEHRPPAGAQRRRRPVVLPDPAGLGWTEPTENGRRYQHGTLTAYQAAKCRCRHCRDASADYRAKRRAAGHDHPRRPRTVITDGHIGNDWFRRNVWAKALATAGITAHITPHGLRHAHASWLLAGGADLQVVKERLGHGSITTTERYLHTLPGADATALAAMDAIRGSRTLAARSL
jgi:integrase